MSFFQRAVTFAAVSLGLLGIAGISTPGFAFETDRTTNVPATGSVPTAPQVQGVTFAPVSEIVQQLPAHEGPGHPAQDAAFAATAPATFAYASLSAAVEAQDAPAAMSDDLNCLAGAIYFESKGEPLAGQLAVAEVIINRSKSGRFPAGVCQVVTQRGQFSFVRGGAIPAIADSPNYRTAVAVAQVALADAWNSPAEDALYFHARRAAPGFRAVKVASIGNHTFYR
ncbi:cell wall hydrolase [Sphingomonas aracearum]|uniref:Cell wall hydrolase n=1 Tax=Sphingomonas aracearum TaxID=2283317 RepID=A0A369VQA5_9SPHN|nr:cell wall hydrolase [Sphingomonas aracearum]RDE04578.1 cell wall hydrolase [Sphingomonas aracearum]